MVAARLPDMRTTPITETIAWSEKRVSITLDVCTAQFTWPDSSVCQLRCSRRNQAHHQDKRNHEVRWTICAVAFPDAILTINREDDSKWPQKNKDGRQELEIRIGNDHIAFEVSLRNQSLGGRYWQQADSKDWIPSRCHRIRRPWRPASVLLSRSRSKGASFQLDCFAL